MTKETLLENLKAAKGFTSVLLIEDMIKLIEGLEPEVKVEKEVGMTEELADKLFEKIERVLDYNSGNLVDKDSAEFSLNYDNRIELDRANIDVRGIMEHVEAAINEFIIMPILEDEEEESDEAEETAMGFETESEETEE